ncbi:hypothetical protein C8J56DRAFT_1037510 [Mycena floridula]|nr:hypothetical protein C8J56DRAFT_1037510 [Mycena floridula]
MDPRQFCRCGNPASTCICFRLPYQSGHSPQWTPNFNQPSHPMYHPQWNFSPPTPSPAPRDSPAFRVALGNVTQASTNQPPMEFHHYTGPPSRASTSTKRTRDSSSDPPRARHQNQRQKTTEALFY